MKFTDEQIAALQEKLDPRHVSKRPQGGRQVSYIEGWWAISEANRIFGFDGWSRETVETNCVWQGDRVTEKGVQSAVSYTAKVRITVGDLIREGNGAGSGFGKDIGEAHESAIKEAETDAMKRALMMFGNPFGLALYDKAQANVGKPAPAPTAPKPDVPGDAEAYEELRKSVWNAIGVDAADNMEGSGALGDFTPEMAADALAQLTERSRSMAGSDDLNRCNAEQKDRLRTLVTDIREALKARSAE